jgi:hypothetical protein
MADVALLQEFCIYGTQIRGSTSSCGTIFSVPPDGNALSCKGLNYLKINALPLLENCSRDMTGVIWNILSQLPFCMIKDPRKILNYNSSRNKRHINWTQSKCTPHNLWEYYPNPRGESLMEHLVSLNLKILNQDTETTSVTCSRKETIDFTLKHNRSGMVTVLGPFEALPYYIHTLISH